MNSEKLFYYCVKDLLLGGKRPTIRTQNIYCHFVSHPKTGIISYLRTTNYTNFTNSKHSDAHINGRKIFRTLFIHSGAQASKIRNEELQNTIARIKVHEEKKIRALGPLGTLS